MICCRRKRQPPLDPITSNYVYTLYTSSMQSTPIQQQTQSALPPPWIFRARRLTPVLIGAYITSDLSANLRIRTSAVDSTVNAPTRHHLYDVIGNTLDRCCACNTPPLFEFPIISPATEAVAKRGMNECVLLLKRAGWPWRDKNICQTVYCGAAREFECVCV